MMVMGLPVRVAQMRRWRKELEVVNFRGGGLDIVKGFVVLMLRNVTRCTVMSLRLRDFEMSMKLQPFFFGC